MKVAKERNIYEDYIRTTKGWRQRRNVIFAEITLDQQREYETFTKNNFRLKTARGRDIYGDYDDVNVTD